MTWHVQYRLGTVDRVGRYPTPEAANIEAACHLIDGGCDVYGIGTGPLSRSRLAGIKSPVFMPSGTDRTSVGVSLEQMLEAMEDISDANQRGVVLVHFDVVEKIFLKIQRIGRGQGQCCRRYPLRR